MKVALIHYRYGPGGGMDAYFSDLVQGFSDLGDQVDIWVYEKSPDKSLPPGVTLRLVPLRPRFRFLKKIAFHTQLVRDLNPSDYDLVIGTMRTIKQDINVNGGTHLGYSRYVNGRLLYTDVLPAYFERKTFRHSRIIIAHSKKVAHEIQNVYRVPADKIHVLYPPVDETRFNPEARRKRPEALSRFGIDSTRFTILFPSTNHKIKGLVPLLEAMTRLPPDRFQLLIAGVPPEKTGPLPENIRYLGYIPKLEELYVACDLVVLPSRYDGFGLVITESLACGIPVLVSKGSGVSELIGPEHGIILENEEPETIARSIEAARDAQFRIEPDFLRARGLTPRQHVEAIKKIQLNKSLIKV